ncbi:MAG: gephyrin-like molybdotransferase Glp [Cellvibrio sp.]|uniref:molybdopterin molybdotransferase MoeA n=1 Tax=Cellvibrio sp. TaxID=1965322 RepID=UPI0031AD6BD2
MDHCAQPGLLPIEEALVRICNQLNPVQESETVPLHAALDRVLAAAIAAPINVPGGDNSAMDGYAVRVLDCTGEIKVIGQSLAGHPFTGEINAGQAVRIMTGALIPAGADAVVMQENVQRDGDSITVNHAPELSENIRRAGEDIASGSQVFAAGHRVTALDIGLLASLGLAQITVVRRLRVALLTTGDELLAPGTAPEAGKIYDSNRPLLGALLTRLAVDVLDLGVIADQPDALRAAFNKATQWADVVISTGGVSVGDADYTKEVLAELGAIDFWKIAMKPGKPFAFGKLGAGWFFGLPGNPVSAAVTYHQLVVPGLCYLAGETFVDAATSANNTLTAITGHAIKKQPGRTDFQRAIFTNENGINVVTSAGLQSSGVLSAMAKANCYIRLEAERGAVAKGETVTVIPFDRFIR